MPPYLTIGILLCFCFDVVMIEAQTGSMIPTNGKIQTLAEDSIFRMISERDCVRLCVGDRLLPCSGISYESYRQECHLIRAITPSIAMVNQSMANWRSYIHTKTT